MVDRGCHSEPFAVILNEVKDLHSRLRINSAKNLDPSRSLP